MFKRIVAMCILSTLAVSSAFAQYPPRTLNEPSSLQEAADTFLVSSYLGYDNWRIDDHNVVHSVNGSVLGSVSTNVPDSCTVSWTYSIDRSQLAQNFSGKIIGDQDVVLRFDLSFKFAHFDTMQYSETLSQEENLRYGRFIFDGDNGVVRVFRKGSMNRFWKDVDLGSTVNFIGFPLGLNLYHISLLFPAPLKESYIRFMTQLQEKCGSGESERGSNQHTKDPNPQNDSSAQNEVSDADIDKFTEQIRSCITLPDGLPNDAFVQLTAHIDSSGISDAPKIVAFFPSSAIGATYAANVADALVRCGPYQIVNQDINATFMPTLD